MNTIGLNFKNFDLKYREIVLRSVDRLEEIINSPLFLEILKDEISKSNNLEGELSHWKEALPIQIYSQLFPITLYLNTYYTPKNVIAFGYPNEKDINLNVKYLAAYSIDKLEDLLSIGSNLLHEHSHDCGFDHDFRDTPRRKNSLSYVLNRAYERTFRKVYGLPEPVIKTFVPWYVRILPWRWF